MKTKNKKKIIILITSVLSLLLVSSFIYLSLSKKDSNSLGDDTSKDKVSESSNSGDNTINNKEKDDSDKKKEETDYFKILIDYIMSNYEKGNVITGYIISLCDDFSISYYPKEEESLFKFQYKYIKDELTYELEFKLDDSTKEKENLEMFFKLSSSNLNILYSGYFEYKINKEDYSISDIYDTNVLNKDEYEDDFLNEINNISSILDNIDNHLKIVDSKLSLSKLGFVYK